MTAARRPIASEGELLPEARLRYIQDLFKSDLALRENLEREGHFARLEAAGKINLSDHLRGRLAAAISCYEEMGCKKKSKSRARQLRAAAQLCERTAKSLETIFGHAGGEGPFLWSTPVFALWTFGIQLPA